MAVTYTYRCTLGHPIDGDTAVLVVDLGFRLTAKMPIRFAGLNCPELNTPAGQQSAQFTADWFSRHPDMTVETEKNPEKYGRWLGTIRPVPDGKTLNQELLDAGLAKPWDGHGPRPD